MRTKELTDAERLASRREQSRRQNMIVKGIHIIETRDVEPEQKVKWITYFIMHACFEMAPADREQRAEIVHTVCEQQALVDDRRRPWSTPNNNYKYRSGKFMSPTAFEDRSRVRDRQLATFLMLVGLDLIEENWSFV